MCVYVLMHLCIATCTPHEGCVPVCVCACVRACVRVCVCMHACVHARAGVCVYSLSVFAFICAVPVLSLSGDQGQEGEHAIQPSCGDQTLHGSRDLG